MRKLFIAIVVVLGMFTSFPVTASAQSGNVRLLLHGTRSITDNGFFGWNAWVVAPNVTSVPNKWLVVTGPRLQTDNWWTEFNAGTVIHDGETTPIIDIRTSWPLPQPFSFWTNFQFTDLSSLSWSYTYGEVNYTLPGGFIVGIETENALPSKSIGPHLVIPLGEAVIQVAYQFHEEGENQLWYRLVVNFR